MRAFSLLELVLILAIVATLAAIAVPRYGNALARYRADATARRIAADLELARATAMRESASVTVTFDVGNNEYELLGVEDLDDPASNAGLTLSDEPYQSELTTALFGLDSEIVYDGYGAPDSGGMVIISCGEATRIILVNPDTGAASVP